MRDNYLLRTFVASGDDSDTTEAFNKYCREHEELGWDLKLATNVTLVGQESKYTLSMLLIFERL